MPQPTPSDVHVDSLLTDVSVAYIQNQDNYLAGTVFPRVPVPKQSDKYTTLDKEDWFRDEAEVRAGGTESAGSGYGVTDTAFFCDVYALHKDVDDQTRANADPAHNPDMEATEFVTQRLLLRQEIQWVSEFFVTAVWGSSVTPGNLWSSYTTSDPISDWQLGSTTILKNTGMEANTAVLGFEVWAQLKHHPDIVDRYKYTSAASVTTDMVASLLEVDRVLVAKAIKNTGPEGGTAAYALTHGKNALLCHVAPSPGLLTPSAGYTFTWTGISAGLGTDIAISTFRMENLKADRIEGEIAFDFKIIGADLGYMFIAAVS